MQTETTCKKIVLKCEKSKEASKVLQLMDCDHGYQEALKIVLADNVKLDKVSLEKELCLYV